MSEKRIAFVYSRLLLGNARLEYMPFGLNTVKSLDNEGVKVDLFLPEKKTKAYDNIFSGNVRIVFLDNEIVWKNGTGRRFFTVFNFYFSRLLKKPSAKYNAVIGMGIAGTHLASVWAQKMKVPFIYMGDEFPDAYSQKGWKDAEKESIKNADLIIEPDEHRIEEIKRQVPSINNKNFAVLPNAPMLADVEFIVKINWHERFGIDPNKKILIFGGGTHSYNQLFEILVTLPLWPEDTVLVINANNFNSKPYEHLLLEGRVFINKILLTDKEYYSLLQHSLLSFGMYRTDVLGLEFVGKSSGKIMRSIGVNRPVIAPNVASLSFVSELGVGVQVKQPAFIPQAIKQIIDNECQYVENCKKAFNASLSFDSYWKKNISLIMGILLMEKK